MESDFTIVLAPNKSHRKTAPKFATSSLVANAAKQSCPQYMRLGFAHGAFETEYQAIVEQRRMIDAVAITDEGIGETAKIEQAIPVGGVAGEARDFEAEHDADMAEGDFGDQTGEAASLNDAGSGNPEVFINDDDLFRDTDLGDIIHLLTPFV